MKRFLKFISDFSIIGLIGTYSKPALALMTLTGVGGIIVVANLNTPTILPQPAAYFNQSQVSGTTNNGLKPPAGVAGVGPMAFPSNATPSTSIGFYFELGIDSAAAFAQGQELPFSGMAMSTNTTPGLPTFFYERGRVGGIAGTEWWQGYGPTIDQSGSATAGTNYANGFYPFTATGSGCARDPAGVWFGGNAAVQIIDTGFLCPPTAVAFQMNAASIAANAPGSGAQQNVGLAASPAQAATTCAGPNLPVTGKITATANVAVAHGITAGQTYTLQGYGAGFTGYNATYIALPATTSTTLVGETTAASCPTSPVTAGNEGTALGGVSATITMTAVSLSNPLASGQTGISTRNNQHICGFLGANGSESGSPFPGAQFLVMVDDKGNSLPGSPALVPFPNQGSANFTGYVTAGAQPNLTVTAMNSYALSAASFTGGLASFTTTAAHGLTVGSEFTVTGASSSGPGNYNHTYSAVAGTTGSTLVGNPLSAPGGTPQTITAPGTYSSSGSLVSVILPGMTLLGSSGPAYIMPYLTSSSTGTGGTGNYALLTNQAAGSFTIASVSGGGISPSPFVTSGTPSPVLTLGTTFTQGANTWVITAVGAGTTNFTATSAGNTLATGAAATTGAIGSIGSPVSLFSFYSMFFTAAASSNPFVGVLTARTGAVIGDFLAQIGGNFSNLSASLSGWGGSIANFTSLYGNFSQANGAPSTSDLASLCTKTQDIQTYATSKGLIVNSFYPLSDLGIFGDHSVATIAASLTNTALAITATPFGSSTAMAVGTVISGVNVPGCPGACPTVASGSGSSYTLTGTGLTVTVPSETMAAGKWKPAVPLAANNFQGYIDTTSGVSTLHVTSLDTTAHTGFSGFTGSLTSNFTGSITSSVLTVTTPTAPNATPVLGVGTQIYLTPGGTLLGTVTSQATTTVAGGVLGLAGTYNLSGATNQASATLYGAGPLPAGPTTLTTSSPTGTIAVGMAVTDGGVSLAGTPVLITGGSGTSWTVAGNYYPAIINDTTMQGSLTTLVPGEYIQTLTGNLITNPVKIVGSTGNAIGLAPGNYTLSGSPNAGNAVGSVGSTVAFTGTTITDGGAIAPGIALTINDKGPGTIFPVNHSTGTATLYLSGTYDAPTLGGTPTAIQAQVSFTAGGPPITGCSACAWTNLASGSVSAGLWTGQELNIPAQNAPLFVSVRASNGTAYATLRNPILIGDAYAVWAQGQGAGLFSPGGYTSFFNGLPGLNKQYSAFSVNSTHMTGPDLPLPGGGTSLFPIAATNSFFRDRFGTTGAANPLSEGIVTFDQSLTNAWGNPTTLADATRDGIGALATTLGNTVQTQTVGVANGTLTTWCSAAGFCGNGTTQVVGQGGPLIFNAAALTGASFQGTIASSSTTLTVGTWTSGALEPGVVLSVAPGVSGFTGNPTLINCLTNCTGINGATSTWAMSAAPCASTCTAIAMFADPGSAGAAPWKYFNVQLSGLAWNLAGFGSPLIQAGTFTLTDTTAATILCQDTQAFAYNNTGGNCTGAGISSSFVNYNTGDYEIVFSAAPATGHVLTASWTTIISPMSVSNTLGRPPGIDYFGNGTFNSGPVSSLMAKTPGGVSGHIYAGWGGTDEGWIYNNGGALAGYQYGAFGYSQMISWLFGTKFPAIIPGASPAVKFITTGEWREEGPNLMQPAGLKTVDGLFDQWSMDVVTKSTFSGSISSNVLTLSGAATGSMWEGEVIDCVTPTTNCGVNQQSGVYITSLTGGAWGASGSTYALAGSPPNVVTAAPMQNDVYYSGSGPAIFAGALNDTLDQANSGLAGTIGSQPHTTNGMAGFGRASRRWAAMLWGADVSNATPAFDPQVDRVKADATGCDAAALAAPCFDVGSTFAASHSATMVSASATITVTGGISAHARPFVVGQVLSCTSCTANRVITSIDVPPTQSTVAGAGEVGQTFHITASGTMGTSATEPLTASCAGTSGTGSNCIDIAVSINNSGTFGTAAAIATCGVNNLNGNAPNYAINNGACQDNGIGELTRSFRIGTQQLMSGNSNASASPGSVFDDGVDVSGGAFHQNQAFTCNIVAAKIVQCVLGPAYSSGVFSAVGQWASGSIYISYGSMQFATGRFASLLGYVGGQSFPFVAGSGYTNNGTQTVAASCATKAAGGLNPQFDVTISGGSIVNVVPSATSTSGSPAPGLGVGAALGATTACTVSPTLTGGSGGSVNAIIVAPTDGQGGIATYNTDTNMMGDFIYDNSGFVGNPLNSFFTNGQGGYFEPGLPLRPFGEFQGEAVSG